MERINDVKELIIFLDEEIKTQLTYPENMLKQNDNQQLKDANDIQLKQLRDDIILQLRDLFKDEEIQSLEQGLYRISTCLEENK